MDSIRPRRLVNLVAVGLLLAGAVRGSTSERILVAGSVSDPAGRPVAGVSIAAVGSEAGAPFRTVTDEDGLFWLEAREGATLRLAKEGWLPREIPAAPELAVVLRRAAALEIRVRDRERDEPVAGARVRLLGKDLEEPVETARTGVSGTASFEGVPPGLYEAEIEAPGRRSKRLEAISLQAGERESRTGRLLHAVVIEGLVVDAAGEPAPGASVGLVFWSRGPDRAYRLGETVETDEDGRFRLQPEGPEHEARWILARAPGHGPAVAEVDIDEKTRHLEASLHLHPPATIDGRVVDEEGKPVDGLELRALEAVSYLGENGEEKRTRPLDLSQIVRGEVGAFSLDDEGRFRLEGVPPGMVYLEPARPGHDPRREKLELEAGERRKVEIVWDEGEILRGEVVDGAGRGVPGAAVRIEWVREGRKGSLEARTDEQGRFRFSGLGDEVHELVVTAEGFAREERHGLPTGGDPIEIALTPAGSISGRVLDAATGEPVGAFGVRVIPQREGEELLGDEKEKVFSDPEGRYHLLDVSPGRYLLEVHSAEHLARRLEEPVGVRPREETPLPPVLLEPGHELRGIIVDGATGLPVAGASVELEPFDEVGDQPEISQIPEGMPHRWFKRVQSDTKGAFRLAGLLEGPYLLSVRHPEYADFFEKTMVPTGGGAPEEVLLGQGGHVIVTCIDGEGAPIPEEVVYLRPRTVYATRARSASGGRAAQSAKTDADGIAVFEEVVPGEYRVTTDFAGPREGDPALEAREGETVRVTLREGTARVEGRATWRGAPVELSEAKLQRCSESGGITRCSRAEEAAIDGPDYVIEGVSPGSYELEAEARALDSTGEVIDLEWSGDLEIDRSAGRIRRDIDFPAYHLTGRLVLEETGEPVPDLHVELGELTTRADSQGTFEIFASDPGPHTLRVRSRRFHVVEPRRIEIPPEGLKGRPVLLRTGGAVLDGTIRGFDGRPVAGVRIRVFSKDEVDGRGGVTIERPGRGASELVHLEHEGGEVTSSYTDSRGRYRLVGLREGPAVVHASHAEHAPFWSGWIELREGEETSRDLQLVAGGSLRVNLPSGPVREGELRLSRPGLPAPVILQVPAGFLYRPLVIDTTDGDFLLPHLEEGTWTVEAEIGGRAVRDVVEISRGKLAVADLEGMD